MKPTVKFAVIFFLVYVILKMVLKIAGLGLELYNLVIFGNMFLIMLAMFLALNVVQKARTEPVSFIADVKTCLQTGMLFAVMATAFIFIYYSYIDPDFLERRTDAQLEVLAELTPESDVPAGMTVHEFIQKKKEEVGMAYNATYYSAMSLAAFTFINFVYAFFLTFLNRKVFSRFR